MSSNWKALQKTLKPTTHPTASPTSTKSKKRQRSSSVDPEPSVIKKSKKGSGKGKEKAIQDDLDDEDEEGDDADESMIGPDGRKIKKRSKGLLPIEAILAGDTAPWQEETGQYLALDCEMVGVGPLGSESTLARVSIVNYHGHTILDRFVRPREKVTDYRTWVSGVREEDLRNAPTFAQVQKEVSDLLKNRILIGHALSNDTQVLLLSHPWTHTRDTAKYQPLQKLARTKKPGLKTLAKLCLGVDIQSGEHSSVSDARATMAVYRTQKSGWESSLKNHTTPTLITSTTLALRSYSSLTPLPPSGRSAKRASMGIAATLRLAREENRKEAEANLKADEDELEVRKRAKEEREEEENLMIGFSFEEKVVEKEKVKEVKEKVKEKKKKVTTNGVAKQGVKGDREKRPKSKEGWWED